VHGGGGGARQPEFVVVTQLCTNGSEEGESQEVVECWDGGKVHAYRYNASIQSDVGGGERGLGEAEEEEEHNSIEG
jgi:hypothetical protein